MTNKHYSITLDSYNEAAALQQLLEALNDALDANNERFERNADSAYYEQFTVTVGGVQTAFVLGGPQTQALCEFIQHIADENFYAVDFDNSTVTD